MLADPPDRRLGFDEPATALGRGFRHSNAIAGSRAERALRPKNFGSFGVLWTYRSVTAA
jgi:hypothetical protein